MVESITASLEKYKSLLDEALQNVNCKKQKCSAFSTIKLLQHSYRFVEVGELFWFEFLSNRREQDAICLSRASVGPGYERVRRMC